MKYFFNAGAAILALLFCLIPGLAFADGENSGWSFDMSCPPWDQAGSTGSFSMNGPAGFSFTGGANTCERLADTYFQQLNFSGATPPSGRTFTSTTLYTLNVGKFALIPPLLSTDNNPVFSVSSQCNNYTADVNYLFIQIDPVDFAGISGSYHWGQSTVSPYSTTITNNFDIDGAETWNGTATLPIGTCSDGVYTLNGKGDLSAAMYSGNDWSGFYKTAPGRATIYLPRAPIVQSALGGLSYPGLVYNSGTPGSVQNVLVSSDSAGAVFTIIPYTDVANNTLSSSTYDTITITSVNSPFDGGMMGTISRNGAGSGKVACLANQGGGTDGQLVACSGQDPADNSLPYSAIFDYKPAPGSADNTFNGPEIGLPGGLGYELTQLSTYAPYLYSTGNGVAVDSLGKIVAVGSAQVGSGNETFALVRYKLDGNLDTSFGVLGTGKILDQISPYSSNPWSGAHSVAIDSSGRVVVAGAARDSTGHNAFAISRYNDNGTVDTSFNGGGPAILQLGSGAYPSSQIDAVAIDGSNKIIVVGFAGDAFANNYSCAVARYNADGTLDNSFNITGSVLTQASVYSSPKTRCFAATLDSDSKIIAVGQVLDAGGHQNAVIIRYNLNGTLDTSFNGTGIATIAMGGVFSNSSQAGAVAIDRAGKIVIGGDAYDDDYMDCFAVARLNTDGTLDTTFNNGLGFTLAQPSVFEDDAESYANAIAIDSAGSIVLAGNANTEDWNSTTAVARFNPDGTLDVAINGTGVGTFQTSTSGDYINSYAWGMTIDRMGKIIILGDASDYFGGNDFALLVLVP